MRRGRAWGSVVFRSNYSESLVERVEGGRYASDYTIEASDVDVRLDMSSKITYHCQIHQIFIWATFVLSVLLRSTNRNPFISWYSVLLLWLHRWNFNCLRYEPIPRPHSHSIRETHLWRWSPKLHWLRSARRHFNHHFLPFGGADIRRDVDWTKWGNAGTMPGLWNHRHWNPFLPCHNTILNYERTNHSGSSIQLLHIRFDAAWRYWLGDWFDHLDGTVWHVFRWVNARSNKQLINMVITLTNSIFLPQASWFHRLVTTKERPLTWPWAVFCRSSCCAASFGPLRECIRVSSSLHCSCLWPNQRNACDQSRKEDGPLIGRRFTMDSFQRGFGC